MSNYEIDPFAGYELETTADQFADATDGPAAELEEELARAAQSQAATPDEQLAATLREHDAALRVIKAMATTSRLHYELTILSCED